MKAEAKGTKPNVTTLDTWRRLYELAAQVRAMEPWKWMEEIDIFGVADAESQRTLFVSVMGALGEYHAIAVYPDTKALAGFWRMQSAVDRNGLGDDLLEIQQLQTVFGKKSELTREEKQRVATLGVACKGANAWSRFLSFRPGWYPWSADEQEAHWLVLALEQLLDVAPRFQKDPHLLGYGRDNHRYLVRECSFANGSTGWRDVRETCPPQGTTFRIEVPGACMEAVRALARREMTVELDVFPSYMGVGKKGERQQMPYILLAVEPRSEFILGMEILTVADTIEDLWMQVPAAAMKLLERNAVRPARLALGKAWMVMVMEGLCKELGIEVMPDPDLKTLRRIRRKMEEFNRR
ncbi:MAG: hypothetical protein WCR06_09310 [bacterium]